ncbi:hypothetical protein FOMPIDRAFT_1053641 [Fomitopsis schrenkii]|uniref:Zinc finger PHD-type domain-containing protein n=1 Tax=Fomitopsis schrenkii TaxID=2126942 RepID=S8DTZ1_FOMSC|nr:hypothetical protein FOMPIDRAFT_1053641 [Fomitopsis schrenkii]
MDASFSDVASSPTLPSDDASDDRDAPGIASIAPTKPLSKSMNNNNKRARNSAERPPPKRIKIREKAAAKVKVEEDGEVDAQRLRAAEEEEQRLLAGGGRVQSRVSEGRIVQQSQQPSNADIAAEWLEIQKRVRKDRIAKVGGTTIAAYISSLTQKTAPRPPASATKRTGRDDFERQDCCISCRDGGELFICSYCPRVFHAKCVGVSKKAMKRIRLASCPQHKCVGCGRGADSAGGMLFRCRTCPQAFCEDCLPLEDVEPLGVTLPEYGVLGFEVTSSAYYIYCDECLRDKDVEPAWWAHWQEEFEAAEKQLEVKSEVQ